MMATLRRSGFATEDISRVYDDLPSIVLAEPRQQLAGTRAELLVVAHPARELPRLVRAREPDIRDGDIEPRGGDHAAAVGDLTLAPADLARFALRRQIGCGNPRDVVPEILLGALKAGCGRGQDVGRLRPAALLGMDDAEIEAGFAVERIARLRRPEPGHGGVEV